MGRNCRAVKIKRRGGWFSDLYDLARLSLSMNDSAYTCRIQNSMILVLRLMHVYCETQ